MARYKDTIWCDGCGIEITWLPTSKGSQIFCCEDCALGLRCDCDQRLEDPEYRGPQQISYLDLVAR